MQIDYVSIDSKDYDYSPGNNIKSKYGYLGLQNQGATCYMNSLLQQLYHIPSFREGLMESYPLCSSESDLKDSLLYQMVFGFASLQV